MDWWMDAYQAGKAAGRKDGWLAGCNGGERRAGKAKWIMTMWGDRWDVQCCVACLPRPPHAAAAAAAPDRAAVGRRSVWTPLPSPAITASSDRETTSLLSPARSPLITVTPRMCCPRPHPPPPPRLNRPAGFWFPSCCDSSSALLSSLSRSLWVIGVPPPQICSPSPQLFRCCCLNLIQVVAPSPRAVVLFF